MAKKYFITGTDTEVGKTYTTVGLLRALQARNQSVAAYKPVAAGAEIIDGKLCNEDAYALAEALGGRQSIEEINPLLLEQAIAPSVAAKQNNVEISPEALLATAKRLDTADVLLVEGAGGWMVPLNDNYRFDQLAVDLQADVILVVGLRLGCINHALLTANAIRASGLRLKAWVANHLTADMPYAEENIAELSIHLGSPPAAVLPFSTLPAETKHFVGLEL